MSTEVSMGDTALSTARRCQRTAEQLLLPDDAKSAWCVVLRKGIWPPSYATDEDTLRDKIARGHRVLATVAAAARPDAVSPEAHAVWDRQGVPSDEAFITGMYSYLGLGANIRVAVDVPYSSRVSRKSLARMLRRAEREACVAPIQQA